MIRLLSFAILILIAATSCRPYKSTVMKPDQITYDTFRKEQKSFTTQSGDIKYIDKGEGPVLVLLHGVPTSGWLYRNMIDELAKTNRVIVPDMLGFGSSDSPDGYEVYNEENHAKRLLELMDALGIQNWTHVTHDAGGLWTWELIRQDATRINRLVLLNTIIYEEGFKPPVKMKKGFFARTAMWSYRNFTNIMLSNLFKSGMIENTLNKQDVEGYKTPLKEDKTKGMYYFFTQTCNALPDYEATLKNLDIPVAVIWGAEDEFLLWEPQKIRVVSDLKISEEDIHIIGAKHFIQEEKPNEIVGFIKQFLIK